MPFPTHYLKHIRWALLLITSTVYAQTDLRGRVTDPAGIAIEFATLALYSAADSTLVKGTVSDSLGQFGFTRMPLGAYYVEARFVGYQPQRSARFTLSEKQPQLLLPTLKLQPGEQDLQTLTVTAKKPLVEQRIDRTVMNIENSILSEGNTALEVLEKAPGVTVDDEGNITLKGKQGATIMINGKLTYLSQKELATLLRGTSSSALSKVEIITNPSAKYDAAGNSGIINIQLKKNERIGFNGNVYANVARSRKNRYGTGLNLNYRSNRLNVFGSYDHAYRGEKELLSYTRRFRDPGESSPSRISFQNTVTDEPLYTNNFKAGIDYFLDSRNTLGLVVNGNVGTYANNGNTSNLLQTITRHTLADARSTNTDDSRWSNLSYNLNYTHRFKQQGRELTTDWDYSANGFQSNQLLDTRYVDETGAFTSRRSTRRGDIPSTTYVYVGKADYTHPLGTKTKLETGWKSSYVTVDNEVKYDTLSGINWVRDFSASNHFTYQETIHAGYVNFNREFGSFSVQAGLRGEYTHTKGHQITSDSLVVRKYFQLFPSLFLTQTLNEKHRLQLSYSRRIERPDYEDLNPFRFFRDPFLYYEGNPFLKPQLTHSLELGHTFNNFLTTTLNYSYTSDVINWMMGQIDSTNTTFQSPQNLKSLINYGISFSASQSPTSWWTTSNFFNVFRNEYKGDQKGGDLDNSITSFTFNAQNSFQLGRGASLELSGVYNSKSVYGVFVTRPFYVISAGVQKQLLNKQATLKLMANDIFQGRRRVQTARYENLDLNTNIRFDSRVITLSFSYRFGNQNLKTGSTRKSGADDVQNRVKGQ
ncbi:outer membrane beta-barrel protein [Siphonobacter curvatus]|uniref:TonB-dependent receptor n=1 Tax=Siphonobacter curvatus TaxID=2094562 RepID=A0A2S7IGL6_9BACT|nr:outer membrane beta-barrel protein [Siphonobacter curvatus]PQA54910.1 TonB-dependent receptor [Siphonobacter curvatus]